MTLDELLETITAAFATVGPPLPSAFAHCRECSEVWLERFQQLPQRWAEIRDEDIEYECHALTAVTPDAWRFMLPAYLRWVARNYRHSESNTVGNVVSVLTWTPATDGYIVECYDSLSSSQINAVVQFLRYLAGQADDPDLSEDAESARQSYWEARAAV